MGVCACTAASGSSPSPCDAPTFDSRLSPPCAPPPAPKLSTILLMQKDTEWFSTLNSHERLPAAGTTATTMWFEPAPT
jgi:hypothetical protein